MRRLVYTPKAMVFVKDQSGNIHDLSSYVTGGMVSRRIDQVSSAEITLRNPEMIFTARVEDNGTLKKPLFHPMDPITIFLERRHGKPVRVFTGYLDTTPYLQLFPGVIQLKASCTLKRLLYTYFDPALPYTRDFLATYGWTTRGGDTLGSSSAFDEFLQEDKKDPLASPQKKDQVDGSLANLLYATLKHIGNWQTKEVYIESLPENVFTRLTSFAQEFAKNNEEITDQFIEVLKTLAGGDAYGGGGADQGEGGEYVGDAYIPTPNKDGYITFDQCAALAESVGLPGVTFAQIAKGESNFKVDAVGDDAAAGYGNTFGLGLWQITTGVGNDAIIEKYGGRDAMLKKPLQNALAAKEIWENAGKSIKPWYGIGHVTGPNLHYTGDLLPSKNPTQRQSDTVRSNGGEDDPAVTSPTRFEHGNGGTDETVRAQRGGDTSKTSTENKIYRPIAGDGVFGRGWRESSKGVTGMTNTSGSTHWHSGVDYAVPGGTPCVTPARGTITMAMDEWSDGGMVHFKFAETTGGIPAGTIIGWGHVKNISVTAGQPIGPGITVASSGVPAGGAHVHFVHIAPGQTETSDGQSDPVPLLTTLQKGEANPVDGGGPGGATGTADPSAGTGASDASIAAGAAFFGTFELPGIMEMAEAQLLGGEKSLMNDKPLLPFVQQLCNASLRHFQSAPDGSFYAFFPDYFGELGAHPPYWQIDDIEILDGNIALTDDSLVTHMYVVGDTVNPASGSSPFITRALASSGVVTVYNMFLADGILNRTQMADKNKKDGDKGVKASGTDIDPSGMGLILEADQVAQFLQRYGARPLVEDMPFIRSPYYEMFLAFQKFLLSWSRQFATPFALTFMPELFPGGKVGFPTHALQMYIEEVQHSWDYTSGFTTTATLSAPSVWHNGSNSEAAKLLPENMVNAIIEPIKSTKSKKNKK